MRNRLLVTLFLSLLVFPFAVHAKTERELTITVSASPQAAFITTLSIKEKAGLADEIRSCERVTFKQLPDLIRATITDGKNVYVYDAFSRLVDTDHRQLVLLSDHLREQIERWVQVVERAHFGAPLPWDNVRNHFKRMTYATVIDMESGEQFRVQRRAGNRHADVQPLTSADTKIMKQLYQGRWSWKRRAILVQVNGTYYAASMHGMPHGAGAISGNNFPGHFCIHFRGSSTHLRKDPDPSHSLMILKASGQLQRSIIEADTKELVNYFLISLSENDWDSVRMTTDGFELPDRLQKIFSIKWEEKMEQVDDFQLFTAVIPVQVDLFERDKGEDKTDWAFFLTRESPLDRWKINAVTWSAPSF